MNSPMIKPPEANPTAIRADGVKCAYSFGVRAITIVATPLFIIRVIDACVLLEVGDDVILADPQPMVHGELKSYV